MNQDTAFTGARVLSPSFDSFGPEATLLVREGKIKQLAYGDAPSFPPGTTVVALNDNYVVPGLTDMHVHVDESLIPNQLEAFLRYGLTVVRDVGSHADLSAALTEGVLGGQTPGPAILSFGELIDGPDPFWPDISVLPKNPEEMQTHVRRIAEMGLPGIKFYFNLGAELMGAGVESAREHGLLTAAHVGGVVSALEALSLGVGSIEHVTTLTQDLVPADAWREKGSFLDQFLLWKEVIDPKSNLSARAIESFLVNKALLVPTLAVMEAIAHGNQSFILANPALKNLEGGVVESWKKMKYTQAWSSEDYATAQTAFEKMQVFTFAYWEAGAPLGVGSDTPNPYVVPGESLLRECELLCDCGIPASDVLRMACLESARYFSQEEQWGTLEEGKAANFVVLESDPLQDIHALRNLSFTVKNGKRIDPFPPRP